MKKYMLGIFAVLLAVAFSAFGVPQKAGGVSDIDWYLVDLNSQETVSDDPFLSNRTKEQAILDGPCNDTGAPVCLVGSIQPVPANTAASTFDTEHSIKEND